MRKIVGYLEGTDSVWLTTLNAQGHTTLPLSNGFDGHGMNIGMLNQQNRVDLLIGYLHKLLPAEGIDVTMAGMLHATTVYGIPVLVVCPAEIQATARELTGDVPANVQFVDPSALPDAALGALA